MIRYFSVLLVSLVGSWAFATDCDDPEFINKFVTVTSFDQGGKSLASIGTLALVGGKDSPQYKEIERLAKTDKKIADMKVAVDAISKEMAETFERVRQTRAIQKQIRLKYEKMYGKNWMAVDSPAPDIVIDHAHPINTERVNAFYREIFNELEKKGLSAMKNPRGNSAAGAPAVGGHPYIDQFRDAIQTAVDRLPFEARYNRATTDLQVYAQNYVEAAVRYQISREGYWADYTLRKMVGLDQTMNYIGLDLESVRMDGAIDRDMLAEHRRAYEDSLVRMASGSTTRKLLGKIDDDPKKGGGKGTAFGWGMIGVVGAAGIGMAASQNAEAHVRSCQKELGLSSSSEIVAAAQNIDPRTIPSAVDQKACAQLKLLPGAAVALMQSNGTYSQGVCKTLHQQLDQATQRFNRPFQVDVKNCENATLTESGKPIGQFVRVDKSRSYFEVPAAEGSFGARFYVDYAGGVDFDPQQVDCTFKKDGKTSVRSSCVSDIKLAVAQASPGGLTPSLELSRNNLFAARRSCGKSGTLSLEPLCRFGESSESIRQALGLFATRCMAETMAQKDLKPAAATH